MITATGLGSGLDVSGLVTQLVSAERAGSDLQISRASSKLNAKLSALGSLKSAMAGLNTSLSGLNNLSSFSKRSATSSDTAAIGVVATSNAVPNNYSLEVTQLASTHGLASPTVVDADTTELGTGTLTFRFGTTDYVAGTDTYNGFVLQPDSKVSTLTIDSSNNTLEGIMTAINDAGFGVSASIVNDGSGFRLLLSSTATGAKNSIEITVADDDANNSDSTGLSRFAFNAAATNAEQTAAASDAEFTVNGLAVSASSNTVKDTIPGLELTLKKITEAAVSVGVKEDTSSVTSAVNSFLNGFNGFVSTVKTLTSYDAEKNTAGTLIGDFTVRSIVSQVNNILRNTISGVTGEYTSLADVGITTNSNGEYVLDSTRFNAAVKAAPTNVKSLFAAVGVASDSQVSLQSTSDASVAGNYAINVSSLATAGTFTGAGVLPDFGVGTVTIDPDNQSLTLEIDGQSTGELLLTPGTYTSGEDLAEEIQARINGAADLVEAGITVTVAYDAGNNRFSIVSDRVGDSSAVKVIAVGANTAADLGFDVGDGVAGTNVAGSIGGIAAVGAGDELFGADDTATEGLRIRIEGSTTGNRGTLDFTRGATSQLKLLLTSLLDADSSLEERIQSTRDSQKNIQARKEKLELRWEIVQQRYLAQFNALDLLVARLNSTSTYLQGQLASLPGVVSNN